MIADGNFSIEVHQATHFKPIIFLKIKQLPDSKLKK